MLIRHLPFGVEMALEDGVEKTLDGRAEKMLAFGVKKSPDDGVEKAPAGVVKNALKFESRNVRILTPGTAAPKHHHLLSIRHQRVVYL